MFRKLLIDLGIVHDEPVQETPVFDMQQIQAVKDFAKNTSVSVKEAMENMKHNMQNNFFYNGQEQEKEKKPKEKYRTFKETEEEKEKRKNYFRNMIDGYERVKGKKFIKQYFVDNIQEKKEQFHGFTRCTSEIQAIEKKIEKDENKKLKKLLTSNKKNG